MTLNFCQIITVELNYFTVLSYLVPTMFLMRKFTARKIINELQNLFQLKIVLDFLIDFQTYLFH